MRTEKTPSPKSPALPGDPTRIVSSVFIGVGVIFISLTVYFFGKDQEESKNSTHLTGHVTRLDLDNEGMAAPVIEYRLNGQKKFIVGTVRSSPPSHDVGDEIDLLVSGVNPSKVIINDPLDRYFLIGIFAFFGVIFGGIGVILLVFLRN